jgi:Tol biopolymer transport system component
MTDVTPSLVFSRIGLGQPATRLSVTADGQPANGKAVDPAASGDGRYVVMMTPSDNLVSGGHPAVNDVVRLDRVSGRFDRVGGAAKDAPSFQPDISADGQVVTFASWAPRPGDAAGYYPRIYVHDARTGKTTCASAAINAPCEHPRVSADGNVIAFVVRPQTGSNTHTQIFAYDCRTGRTSPVAVAPRNCWDPAISADGRFVAFVSTDAGLAPAEREVQSKADLDGMGHLFVHDRATGTTRRLDAGTDNESYHPSISADGRYVAYVNQKPLERGSHVRIHDMQTGSDSEVRLDSDGQRIANAGFPSVSADGRYVSFVGSLGESHSNNVFVYDRELHRVACASVNAGGEPANRMCRAPHLSADGTTVTYESEATNLVAQGASAEQIYASPNPLHPQAEARALEAAERQARERAASAGTVEKRDDFVVIGGVRVPRRLAFLLAD